MKTSKIIAVLMLVAFLGFASSSLAVGPGKKPGAVAPKLEVGVDNVKIWDHPEAFGPVPSKLKALGKKACGPGKKAIGYHPKALDENGNVFPRGGFFCVPGK